MTRTGAVTFLAATACILISIVGCSAGETIDTAPLPSVAAPPYLCGQLPRDAVERMTGLPDPVVRGSFDLAAVGGHGTGWCIVYEPGEERTQVLEVSLLTDFAARRAEDEIRLGAKRLPSIVPGADGYYATKRSGDEDIGAVAVLTRGRSTLVVSLDKNIEGRNAEADVVALMKLIAPKLITDASAVSPTPAEGN